MRGSLSRLQSSSISAVLPEPTGPPTPTRRDCLGVVITVGILRTRLGANFHVIWLAIAPDAVERDARLTLSRIRALRQGRRIRLAAGAPFRCGTLLRRPPQRLVVAGEDRPGDRPFAGDDGGDKLARAAAHRPEGCVAALQESLQFA